MSESQFDISKKPSIHSRKNKLMRVLWWFVYVTVFRLSPRPLTRWRAFLLRLFGGKISPKARVHRKVTVWAPWLLEMGDYATLGENVEVFNLAPVKIGHQTTVSQYSYLVAGIHDYEDPKFTVIPMPIEIGDNCWIAADVFIGGGVTIGDGTVVGARSSVFRSLPAWKVCFGTPCKVQKDRVMRSGKQPAPSPEPQREGAPA